MTPEVKIYAIAMFATIVVVQARYQAKRFALNLTINHLSKGGIYAVLIALVTGTAYIIWDKFFWELIIIGDLFRAAFFDPILNGFRKKDWWYNGTQAGGEGNKGSWIDRIENKLSVTWVKVLKIIYIAAFVAAIIFL